MVGNGYDGVAMLVAQLTKPGIAQTASSHLHRLTRALHLGSGIETFIEKLNTETLCLVLNKELILVALFATQLEVAVGNTKPISSSSRERHENHRVDTT